MIAFSRKTKGLWVRQDGAHGRLGIACLCLLTDEDLLQKLGRLVSILARSPIATLPLPRPLPSLIPMRQVPGRGLGGQRGSHEPSVRGF